MSLEWEIRTALNRASAENESDTPDFILAEYLTDCLEAFNKATINRQDWHKGFEVATREDHGE